MASEVLGQDMLKIVVSIAIGMLTYGLIARWYVMPALANLSRHDALIPLVLPHAFRYIGLAFLIPGVVSPDVTHDFAVPAAYGDLLASVLALLAAVALKFRWSIAIPAVWIFNLEGSLDALYAVSQWSPACRCRPTGWSGFYPSPSCPSLDRNARYDIPDSAEESGVKSQGQGKAGSGVRGQGKQ